MPASTGYGDPVQKLFKLKDGEKIVAAFSLDPRVAKKIEAKKEGDVRRRCTRIAVTSDGYACASRSQSFVEPSTRSGRRYARARRRRRSGERRHDDRRRNLIAATAKRARHAVQAEEVNFLSGPGRGVILIKLDSTTTVIGAIVSSGDRDLLTVETTRGAEQTISTGQVRSDRPRRQGPGADAAGAVRADAAAGRGAAGAPGERVV